MKQLCCMADFNPAKQGIPQQAAGIALLGIHLRMACGQWWQLQFTCILVIEVRS